MLNDKLTVAAHITRKSGPWVSMAVSALIIAANLKTNH